MTREEETLRAARKRMTAALAETQRWMADAEAEHAARILADLWLALEAHGATDDLLRGAVNLPGVAISVVDALDRQARALAALAGRITADELLASPREVQLMKEEEELHNAPGNGSSSGGLGSASVMADGITVGVSIGDPVNGSILEPDDRM